MNILLIMIIAALLILFLMGVVLRLLQRFEKPKGNSNPLVIMDKAPGRILVRVIGIIYIAIAFVVLLALVLLITSSMEYGPTTMIIQAAWYFYIGIFAVAKYNDLTESYKLQGLAIFNLFLTITWLRDSIWVIVIIVALSILFFVGAVKNYKAYQWLLQQDIHVEKPKGNSKEPMPAKPLGKTLLRIAGALLIILVVLTIRHILPTTIMAVIEFGSGRVAWIGLFVMFLPLCFCLFSGILGVVKSNDLKKARTLRTLAITTIVLFGVTNALGALLTSVLIIGLALLIPFFIGAQINYMEYKRLPQQQMSGRRLH